MIKSCKSLLGVSIGDWKKVLESCAVVNKNDKQVNGPVRLGIIGAGEITRIALGSVNAAPFGAGPVFDPAPHFTAIHIQP